MTTNLTQTLELNRSRPAYKGRTHHYRYGFEFYIDAGRIGDLETILSGMNFGSHRFTNNRLGKSFLSFRYKKDAMLFKIVWVPCDYNLSVIIPLVRRVMPALLAQDIIGVQPMTGPVASIHKMRAQYAGGSYAPIGQSTQTPLGQLLANTRAALEEKVGPAGTPPADDSKSDDDPGE
jgi:hypothetical protein